MEKIIHKWSLEVVAVPQEQEIHVPAANATENITPIKVKIRIKRGKNNDVFRKTIISVPKIEQANEYTETVRVIDSDQTILSFDVLMKAEHKSKAHRKSQNKFFHLFKTGKCLGTQGEEKEDPPYLLATSVLSNEVNSEGQESYDDQIQNISLSQNKCNIKTFKDITKEPIFFLGKCKRGGCLDPPFSEDKYRYQPYIQSKQGPNYKKKYRATCEKPSKNTIKHSEVTVKISNYEEIDTLSTLMLYRAKSEKSLLDKKYSDYIITYPPDTSSKDLEKNIMTRKSNAIQNRVSSNVTDTYFMPPKVDRSPERSINRNKLIINSREEELKDYSHSNDISGVSSIFPESNNLHIIEVTENVLLNMKEIKEPDASFKTETDNIFENNNNAFKSKNIHSQYKSLSRQSFNLSIIDRESHITKLESEELHKVDEYKTCTDDVISKPQNMLKVEPQIKDKISPKISKAISSSSLVSNIHNEDNEHLKLKNASEKIKDGFSQEYLNPQLVLSNPDDIIVPDITKLELVDTVTNNTIKTNFSQTVTEEQTKNEKEDITNKLDLLDHTELQSSDHNNNKYNVNIVGENDLSLIQQKTESELQLDSCKIPSDKYIDEINSQITKSQLDLNETQYKKYVAESCVDPKSLSKRYAKDDNAIGIGYDQTGEEYKDMSDILVITEISDIAHKLKDYNRKDIYPTASIKSSITATSTHWTSDINSIHPDSSLLSNKESTSDLIDNEMDERRSSVNSQQIELDTQNKTWTTEIKNDETIALDNYVTNKNGTKQSTDYLFHDEGHEKRSSINSQHIQSDKDSTMIENNKMIATDNENNSILKRSIERQSVLNHELIPEKKSTNPQSTTIVSFNTESTPPNTLSETKIISVVHKYESEPDFQNSGNSFDYKKTMSGDDKIDQNTNINEELNVSNSDISVKNQRFYTADNNFRNKSTDKYLDNLHDISKQDFIPDVCDVKWTSFEEKNIEKFSSENISNNAMIIDLAFQTYVNDNNETILRTFDVSKEPQRFPHDNISITKFALKLDDNILSFAINSKIKMSVEIIKDYDNSTKAEERSREIEENIADEMDRINKEKKYSELSNKKTLQRSLAAIYENDLVPVENLIKNLILEIEQLAKYRFLIKNSLTATEKLKSLKPTMPNKICGCLRK